ncbi:hypothetical protein [Methylobacterium phyllostachyos]|uniref:hypothetical protein n=1 Tax=Methylobacterium phyllostachyos TaxID=582672 RepID=UPI00115FA278|nr:hypothetical protein [Methylobacterium phyllostachyos]
MTVYTGDCAAENSVRFTEAQSSDLRLDLRVLLSTTAENFYRRSFLLNEQMALEYRRISYEFRDTADSLDADINLDTSIGAEKMAVLMKALAASRYLAEIEWQEARAVHDKLAELLMGNARE